MFERLENVYGRFIRLLNLVLTVLLMVFVVILFVNWQRVTADDEPAADAQAQTAPKVATSDLVKRVVANQTGAGGGLIDDDDPNRNAYSRIAKAVSAFALKHNVSREDADLSSTIGSIRQAADSQDTDQLKAGYVNGLADVVEHALVDPNIEALLSTSSRKTGADLSDGATPMGIVSDVIDRYNTAFSQQLAHINPAKDGELKAKKKDAALRLLQQIGVPFLLLVVMLQLLTFGRIEQNTRRAAGGRG